MRKDGIEECRFYSNLYSYRTKSRRFKVKKKADDCAIETIAGDCVVSLTGAYVERA